MDIIIQSLGFTASENLNTFVKEKLNKLISQDDIVRANVTLFEDGQSHDNKYCEIRLEVPGNDHFVKKNNGVYETAITDAVDALHKVLRRSKDKEVSQRNHAGV
jgi:putative sigma-54 modulation protein